MAGSKMLADCGFTLRQGKGSPDPVGILMVQKADPAGVLVEGLLPWARNAYCARQNGETTPPLPRPGKPPLQCSLPGCKARRDQLITRGVAGCHRSVCEATHMQVSKYTGMDICTRHPDLSRGGSVQR